MVGRALPLLLATLALGPTGSVSSYAWSEAAPSTDRWEFRVTLDNREIGYHHFERKQIGEWEQIDIEARFQVRVLFITAYQYTHDNSETWAGDCLKAIESTTDDNGTDYTLSGTESSEGFSLLRNQERAELGPDCVQTFAYWNPDILNAQKLLNAQTGMVEPVSIDFRGKREIEVQGAMVQSNEYVISTADGDITVWYSEDSTQWLGLETLADGDRVLRYEPLTVPQALSTPGQFAGPASAP